MSSSICHTAGGVLFSLFISAVPAAASVDLPACSFEAKLEELRTQGGEAVATPRPPHASTLVSSHLPLAVHYESSVADDYAREILTYAETAWRIMFHEKGFLTPHPDGTDGGDERFDVYIVTSLPAGVGGYTGFSGFNESTPRADAVGYVVIADAIDPRIRRFVVAHELFHASQIAYDWWEDLAFMEGSATWIVDHVFDDENIYWRYFPYYNAEPFKALDFISMMSPYQYGMGLFSLFLDERYGYGDAQLIRQLWERTTQDSTDNEPDFLDAAASLVAESGGIDEGMREFGVWRLLVGSRKTYGKFGEVSLWDDRMDPYFEVDMPPGVTAAEGVSVNPLQPLSHGFLRFSGPTGEYAALTVTLATDGPGRFAVDWVTIGPSGAKVTRGGLVGAGEERQFRLEADPERREVIFVVTNLSAPDHDTDTSPWLGQPFRYQFSATPE